MGAKVASEWQNEECFKIPKKWRKVIVVNKLYEAFQIFPEPGGGAIK